MMRLLGLLHRARIHRLGDLLMGGLGTLLMLHRVVPERSNLRARVGGNARMEVSTNYLDSVIRHLVDRGYEPISLDQVPARLATPVEGSRFVCFTFDDGYADNHALAYPVFRRHGVPFTVYVTTGFTDRTHLPWWYVLEDLVLERNRITPPEGGTTLSANNAAEKQNAFAHLRALLMTATPGRLRLILEELMRTHGMDIDRYHDLAMSWDQVRELARDPLVTIGAHTVSHANLARLTPSECQAELEASKRRLEERIEHPVHHFAYPFGSRDEMDAPALAAARKRFRTTTTTRQGNLFPAHGSLLNCLPRIPVVGAEQEDLELLDLRLGGLVTLVRHGPRRVVAA